MTTPSELRSGVVVVTSAASRVLDNVLARVSTTSDAREALVEVLPPIMEAYGEATGALAADWYDEYRDSKGVGGSFTAYPSLPDDFHTDSLARWATQPVRVAVEDDVIDLDSLHDHGGVSVTVDGAEILDEPRVSVSYEDRPLEDVLTRVQSGVQSRLTNVGRSTVMDSSLIDPNALGWQRIARPGACAFCVMLAEREELYTERTADFAAHWNCNCAAVAVFDGVEREVRDYTKSHRRITAADRAGVRRWMKENLPDVRG